MFEPNQRVKVNLSGLTIKGVAFSQNVQEALGAIVERVAVEPPMYLVELLFSFKGVKCVEVPEERLRRACLLARRNPEVRVMSTLSGCSVSDGCDVPERLYIAAADGTADRID